MWELETSHFGAKLGWNAVFLSGLPSSVSQRMAKPKSCRWPELQSPEIHLLHSLLRNSRKSLNFWEFWFKEQLDTYSSLDMAQFLQWLCLELEYSKQAKDRHLAVHLQNPVLSIPSWQNWLKLLFCYFTQCGHCKPPFVTALSGPALTAPPNNRASSQSSKNQVVSTKFQQRGQEDCRVLCPFLCQLLLPFHELSFSLARNFTSQFRDFMDRSI